MKLNSFALALAFLFGLMGLYGCDKCPTTNSIVICSEAGGARQQSFAVTYVDTADVNYISGGIFNLANVRVYLSTDGTEDNLLLIQEDFTDGKIGPFYFTCPEITPNFQDGVVYEYLIKIEKDTWGVDYFILNFATQVDECNKRWSLLKFYRNKIYNPTYTGVEVVDWVIKE